MEKAMPHEVRLRARRRRRREAVEPAGASARQPDASRRRGAARLSRPCSVRRARDLLEGERPSGPRATIAGAAARAARHRQPRVEGALRHRSRRTRRATSVSTANGRRIPSCSITSRSTSSITACRSRRCIARSCGAPSYQLERRSPAGRLRQGQRQSSLLAREPPPHERRADSRFGAVRLRRARRASGRAVGAADAARRSPHIYGRVSRYKLDEFLQLFDFPSPSQTAEQRFSTNVPLQRLFFMNSDFVQQHAERLAE